jgi:hypothetical protein
MTGLIIWPGAALMQKWVQISPKNCHCIALHCIALHCIALVDTLYIYYIYFSNADFVQIQFFQSWVILISRFIDCQNSAQIGVFHIAFSIKTANRFRSAEILADHGCDEKSSSAS